MRFLHTADWHVGKTLRGRSRADEHRAVLREIAEIADERAVDAVLVAGDLFDTAAPSPESEKIVYDALLRLAAGREVVVIAGNHDNPRRLQAVAPLLELGRVRSLGAIARPDEGGVIETESKSGERARIALLPFVSQRGIIRAEALMSEDADQHSAEYAERLARIVEHLCGDTDPDAIHLLVGHAMAHGGVLGGGERSAHTVFAYSVPTTAFPAHLHYAALGHLHREQKLEGRCPVHYCGSPLQLDFGETRDEKSVKVIEAEPGKPARIEIAPLSAGKRLRRVRGALAELKAQADGGDDEYLLVEVTEPPRLGLADEVREALPNAVEVRLQRPETSPDTAPDDRRGRPPQESFREYLVERGETDERVEALFAELLDETHAA